MGLMVMGKLRTMNVLADMDRLLSQIRTAVGKQDLAAALVPRSFAWDLKQLKEPDYRTALRRRSETAGDALMISMSRLLSFVWRRQDSLVHEIRQEEQPAGQE